MRENFLYMAALHAFHFLSAEDLQLAVDGAMNHGFYADSCIDALISKPARMHEVEPAFNAALGYYKIPQLDCERAIWILIEFHLRRIASGEVDPVEYSDRFMNETNLAYDFHAHAKDFLGDSHGIARLIGLHYEIDDARDWRHEIDTRGGQMKERIDRIRRDIRDAAKKWLATMPLDPVFNEAQHS